MDLLDRIDALIAERHLLKHPFYTKWKAGELTREELQEYARQYYAFESTFPRLLSALHTRSDRPDVRQSLLDNLWDEEHGEVNHAEMWLRFGEGIGVERTSVRSAAHNEGTRALLDTYWSAVSDGRSRPASRRSMRTRARSPRWRPRRSAGWSSSTASTIRERWPSSRCTPPWTLSIRVPSAR